IGFAVIVILLLVNSHADFIASVNSQAHKIFGVSNAFGKTQIAAGKDAYVAPAFGVTPLTASLLLVPLMMFFIMWPNWGAPICGASDFRRVFTGMFAGLWITVILAVIFLLVVTKTFGNEFYNNSNAVYWTWYYGGKVAPPIPIWPYPVMLAGWLVHNAAFQAA